MSRRSPRAAVLRRGCSGHPAFTLIELLVVIAIIAVLAAILFPVFADGHTKALKPLSTSNADDGSGVNLWDFEGRPFTDLSAGYTSATQATVKANLAFAQQNWH